MAMQEGEKIYVESLLTDAEFKECSKKYTTYKTSEKGAFFNSEMKWRYKMGEGFTDAELTIAAKRIKEMLTKNNLQNVN